MEAKADCMRESVDTLIILQSHLGGLIVTSPVLSECSEQTSS